MTWLFLLSLGCVLDRTQQSGPAQMQREIRENAVRVYNVEQHVMQVEARVNQLEELNRSSGKRKIMQMETIEELRGEVVRMRGSLEVLTHDAAQGAKGLQGAVDDARFRVMWLESRADQLEKSLGMKTPAPPAMPAADAGAPAAAKPSSWDGTAKKLPEAAAPLPEASGASKDDAVAVAEPPEPPPVSKAAEPERTTPPVDPVTEPALDPNKLLDNAKKQIKSGNTVGAETMLSRFLEAFPNHARADEATYRRAEASKVAGEHEKAVLRYQEVIDQFKASSFAPWAMLRQGEVFDAKGDPDSARVFYGEVIRIYPKSRAAKAARKALSK